jgi:peptidoglycan/xylan/chitin deacetylase (PgdA/CDA1 family)
MTELYSPMLASLPLLLWKTPPGLELILAQEGMAFETVKDPHPFSFRGGRFVLYDSRVVSPPSLRSLLSPDHIAIDIDSLRGGEPVDPFEALIDDRAAIGSWTVGPWKLSERVARFPKAWIRRRLIGKLREAVTRSGGVWIRLAPFPHPYRAGFSLRVDLDEPVPEDYHRFAKARAPLDGCCTHFLSTNAYTDIPSVLSDLRQHDTQSHGHFHHVYREPEANRVNLERAHRILRSSGFEPVGFAAPHGRWRLSLDDQLEDMGYLYSSDFQLGHDDFPFYPWKGDRFSRILQIPVHPVCEGLLIEAGARDPAIIADYFRRVLGAKFNAGELAVVYGHPERRLGRMPEVMTALVEATSSQPLVWRANFTEVARWWRWRAERRWLVIAHDDHRLEIQFDEWDTEYDFAVEIHRGRFYCSLPVTGPRMSLGLADLVYERSEPTKPDLDPPTVDRGSLSLKQAMRTALDWETVTPLEAIPRSSISNHLKRGLRRWKHNRTGTAP